MRLMQIVGEGREGTPVRLAMSADGLELSATAQERADAIEAIDAKFEGTDVTVAFNPQFLLDGLLRDRGRRGRARDDGPAEARDVEGHGPAGVPVPPDARPHLLTPRPSGRRT